MKIKLDENLGSSCASFLAESGHDAETVYGEGLAGASDLEIISTCRAENLVLVTLDKDFSDPIRFSPKESPGIAVLRAPGKNRLQDILSCLDTLVEGLRTKSIGQQLWIVQKGRIRIFGGFK